MTKRSHGAAGAGKVEGTGQMMGSRGTRGGDEYDALSHRARKLLTWSRGELRTIKRKFWKRQRKTARTESAVKNASQTL